LGLVFLGRQYAPRDNYLLLHSDNPSNKEAADEGEVADAIMLTRDENES